METVEKFGWAPDIIHCHGWMTSLVPLYLNKIYRNDPIFEKSKLIYSAYNETLASTFDQGFFNKATINNLENEDLSAFKNGDDIILHEGAIKYADALISGQVDLNDSLKGLIDASDAPNLVLESDDYLAQYLEFYKSLLEEETES